MTSNNTAAAMPAAANDPPQSPFASPVGQAAADAALNPSQHAAQPPNSAVPATRAISDIDPAADRATSTTALLAGVGPTSSLAAPTLAPIRPDDLLPDIAADIGADTLGNDDAHAALDAHKAAAAAAAAAGPSNGSKCATFASMARSPSGASGRKKRMIPLRQVLRHSYEYHGLNELAMFCVTALAVTLVLYWHWGTYTAIFKASVQQSFQSYGNPDWQTQTMQGVDTMNDAVEYGIGWLEFWLQRADAINLPNDVVRAQDYADLQYVRILANLDRNCDPEFSPHLSCYKRDPLYQPMLAGAFGPYNHSHPRNSYTNGDNPDVDWKHGVANTTGYANLLEWAGWSNVFQLRHRDSAKVNKGDYWWAYTVVAPRYYNRPATRDDYIGRMYNITRLTSLNINNCDWLASNCSVSCSGTGNPCAPQQVPFSDWFNDTAMCPFGANTTDNFTAGPAVERGNRTFVLDPTGRSTPGGSNILDLKAYLAKYAYSIVIDVLAANTLGDEAYAYEGEYSASRDRALFSLLFQRSAEAKGTPNRVMWQISTTVPVRTSFYVYKTDFTRIGFEILLLICVAVVLYYQVLQFRICKMQFRSWKPFFAHYWNDYEIVSTLLLVAWLVYYIALVIQLRVRDDHWKFEQWDVVTPQYPGAVNAHEQLENLIFWANGYGAWLYMGIVVNFLIYVRVARYLRVHVGLKAFYQVFIIAGREFMDFAVFLLFILVVLGSAVFAFFQLTGGNYQFLRFADGLAVMTRLTFGFLNYEDFQAQALGVGAAVSAVTLLFWLAVVLLVVYTQNIILAIVAEAYEEAKAKLGSAETSFLMLVCMRLLFFFLYILYRSKMFCGDIHRLFTGKRQLSPSQQSRTYSHPTYPTDGDQGSGPGGNGASGQPGSPRGDDLLGIVASAGTFDGIDATPRTDQDDYTDFGPFAADSGNGLAPQTSVMGMLPKDVESGLKAGPVSSVIRSTPVIRSTSRQPTGRFLLFMSTRDRARSTPTINEVPGRMSLREQHEQNMSIKHRLKLLWYGLVSERHDVRMYQDLLLAPKKDEEGWIAAWKRRYWAPWCVARTRPVKGLMSLYQDFSSYKLKEECTWPQAQDMAGSVFALCHPTCMTAAGAGNIMPVTSTAVPVRLPPLTDDPTGYVDEATLARLFLLVNKMSDVVPICQSPFPDLTVQSVSYLVRGISEVYGVDAEDIDMLGPDALAPGQGSLSSSGGSADARDARLGQVMPRRGTGFFGQLNAKRREGAEQSKQVTMMLHAQRRLEESAHKTERNLDLYRTHATQQANKTASELHKQREQQLEVLRAVKQLQTTVQNLAAAPYGSAGSSFSSSIAPAAERASSSRTALRKGGSLARKMLGGHKTSSPGLPRGASDLASLGSPHAADSGHDAVDAAAADAPSAAGPSSVFSFNASSGPSHVTSDAGQVDDPLARLQEQLDQQGRLLKALADQLLAQREQQE